MKIDRYGNTREFIIKKLQSGLPETLYYHSIQHVMDVLEAAEMLGKKEHITEHEMELLKVAVLFHDSGFIINAHEHEKIGCDIAKENLPDLGYSEEEIEVICGMIMVTKYPPVPKNFLEEIICDADLDYLGRDDFFEIGKSLYKELLASGSVSSEKEWNELQENFLRSHHYFTQTAKELRDKKKQEHLERVRELLKIEDSPRR
ncbi:MAG: HD domain-containing protein [Bacteroidetes bacterium]|nr:HD domain-containing protein [Bacteroidota bacterium]